MLFTSANIKPLTVILLILYLFFANQKASAQLIEKKLDSGEDTLKYVWVILAEGYTEAEAEKFQDDVSFIIDGFFSVSPFKEYKSAINIYTVFNPSDESGADHPSDATYVDTSFDATFDSYGIERLLTVNEEKAFASASQISHFDLVFVLVNDDQYGGSGGSVIAVSTNSSSIEIALHEAGHVIGKLADEYETEYPGYPAGDYEPNVTYQDTRDKVPWKDWIDPDVPVPTFDDDDFKNSLGLFEGARYCSNDIFRPKHECKMRMLNKPFCEICTEALLMNIYNFVNPIENFSPVEAETELTSNTAVTFQADTIKLNGSSYDFLWEVDDEILADESKTSFALFPSFVKQGKHTVKIWISDNTEMVRTDVHGLLTSSHTWSVNKGFCSGKLTVHANDKKKGQAITDATIAVSDTTHTLRHDTDGIYELNDITCGSYLITAIAPGFAASKKNISITDGVTTLLDVSLQPLEDTYYISGNIFGENNDNIDITLSGDIVLSAKTDSDGAFVLGPLEPGPYTVTANATGVKFTPSSQRVDIQDRDISDISFTARSSGLFPLISGIIKGVVKEGVTVLVSGTKKDSTYTDQEGSFELEDLPPGQYVIRPNHAGIIFKPAEYKIDVADNNLTSLNFTAEESSCPVSQISPQNSANLSRLRQYRDSVLRKSTKGSSYIRLYYLVSQETSKILQKSGSLQKEAQQTLIECMPVIEMKLKDSQAEIPEAAKTSMKVFAQHLSKHGSPMLKKVIDQFLKDLEQGNL